MKKHILLSLFTLFLTLGVNSQIYTWTNADADFDFENPNNWSPTPMFDNYPTFGENAVFDGNITNDGVVVSQDWDLNAMAFVNGYSGVVDNSGFGLTVNNINLTSGTLIAPTSELRISGNLIKSPSGVFTHSGGTVKYSLSSTSARSINGAFGFNNLEISTAIDAANRTITFGGSNGTPTCQALSLNGGANPMAYRGTINVTSSLTILGTTAAAAPNNTGTIVFTGAGAKTIIGTSSASLNPIRNITMNHSGALSMSGHIATTGTWNFTNVGSFSAGTSTVTAIGGTVSSGTTTTSRGFFDNLTIGGAGLTFNGTSQVELRGNLTNNSSITANNSLLIFNGSSAQSIGGTNAATLNAVQISNNVGSLGIALSILDSVKISGGALTTGGLLTLRSSSAKKARIAEIVGGVLLGNVTVETFAPGGTTDWVNLGVSGVSGKTLSDWDGQIPMTCNGCANGTTTAGGPFASTTSWDETLPNGDPNAYVTLSNTSPLTPGRGFWIYLGNGLTTTTDMIWTVSGPPVTGNVNISLSNSGAANGDGYNLIANPYASPISWTKLRNGNASVNNAIYIYNPDLGLTTSFVNGVSTPASASANDVIPMGQGFYVQANAATNLTAQETNKVSHNTSANPLLKSANSSNSIGDVIRLNVVGGGYADDAAIRFNSNATTSFDSEWDAHKLYASPGYVGFPGAWTKRTVIATQMNNEDYSINSLPHPTTQNAVIPVIVRVYSTGQYTISGSDLQNLPPNACVTLWDKLTNIHHNLKGGDYVCNISDTTYAARFELTVCGTAVPTNIKTQTSVSNAIFINKDSKGVFVSLDFEATTDADIYVTNVLGQKLMDSKHVKTTKGVYYLDIDTKDQLIFVTVVTNKERVTKKFINYN